MSVEVNAKFITELNEAYPRKGDLIKEGDDHMRLIKSVIKNTLPGLNRTVNITSEKLNHIDTMTETTEDTLTIKGNIKVSDKKTVNLGDNIVSGVSDPVEDTDVVNKRFLKKEGIEFAWPVNSVFMTMDTKDPKEIFGFGEWEKFASGRVIIGTGSDKDVSGEAKLIALGAKGGNYNEVLKTEHLPAHQHPGEGLVITIEKGGSHSHTYPYNRDKAHRSKADIDNVTGMSGGSVGRTNDGGDHSHTGKASGNTGATGGGQKHNNMMPYIGVHIWKRIK